MAARPQLAALSAWIDEFETDPATSLSVRAVPSGATEVRRFSRWRNPLNHPAVILRRSLVQQVGGYQACSGFEDYHLWLRLLQAGFVIDNLAQPLVLARVGPDHTARRNGWRYLRAEADFLWRCGREHLFSWPHVWLLAVLRLPIRLIPVPLQTALMRRALRNRQR